MNVLPYQHEINLPRHRILFSAVGIFAAATSLDQHCSTKSMMVVIWDKSHWMAMAPLTMTSEDFALQLASPLLQSMAKSIWIFIRGLSFHCFQEQRHGD